MYCKQWTLKRTVKREQSELVEDIGFGAILLLKISPVKLLKENSWAVENSYTVLGN